MRSRLLSPLSCFTSLVVLVSAVPLFLGSSQAASRPRIVLVTLESVRADHAAVSRTKPKMPNLAALAKQSIAFENAYSQSPGTVASEATILSGSYPQTHGASELSGSVSASVPYLSDLLRAKGYRTAAFVGSILLDPRNGFAPGFERGFSIYDAGFKEVQPDATKAVRPYRAAVQVITRAVSWLTRNGAGPFFLWVNFGDASALSRPAYDRTILADDEALGKLIAALRTQKLYDDCIIVVAADHGQSLGAHGEETHGVFLYDETTHVPLLVKLPQNQLAGKRVKGRVRLVDIAPSVLEGAGLPVPSQMQGQSLLRVAKVAPDTDQAAYARSDFPQQAFGWSVLESWRSGRYLYVRAPKPELYDLSSDPNATHNLAQSSKAITDTMASQLAAFDSHFGGEKTSGNGLTSSEVEKLASLGYVGLQKSASAAQTAVSGMDPKDNIVAVNKTLSAMTALQQGQADKAEPALRQVVSNQSSAYLPQYGLGFALLQMRNYKEAIEHFHKAIEVRPDSGRAQYGMGLCLLNAANFKTAAVHLEIAANRLPAFSAAHAALAQAYEQLGRKQEASRERARASQPGPS